MTLKDTFRLILQSNKIIRENLNDRSGFRRLNWGGIHNDKNGTIGLHTHYAITLKIVRMDQLKARGETPRKATDPLLPLYCAITD